MTRTAPACAAEIAHSRIGAGRLRPQRLTSWFRCWTSLSPFLLAITGMTAQLPLAGFSLPTDSVQLPAAGQQHDGGRYWCQPRGWDTVARRYEPLLRRCAHCG